jgi:glucoamylase
MTRARCNQTTGAKSATISLDAASIEEWGRRQLCAALDHMKRSISATGLTHEREEFFQRITPRPGSVVASPTIGKAAHPDYFFHWLRDSALVMHALALAMELGYEDESSIRHLHDFVEFSLATNRLSGPALLAASGPGETSRPELARYLRSAHELEAIIGDLLPGEARFNPDASLDILKWSRPQFDGPALRALTLLRRMPLFEQDGGKARDLLRADLQFVLSHVGDPCYDIWEHRFGHHYHTRVVSLAALTRGALWARQAGLSGDAALYEAGAAELHRQLDYHWSPESGFYLAAIKGTPTPADGDLDSATLLAVVNAQLASGRHSVVDPRVQATLERLEELFAAIFPINRSIAPADAPLLGRFRGDGYFGGGVFLFSAFAAAEIYYRLARHALVEGRLRAEDDNARFLERCGLSHLRARGPDVALEDESERGAIGAVFRNRGDSILLALARHTPASGEMSEQIDKTSGEPASARNLTWSYAAFITAFAAREQSLQRG